MSEIEQSIQKAGSWIPQVFFDLIARVVPGVISLLVFAVCYLGPADFPRLVGGWLRQPPTTGALLGLILPLAIAVSYTAAICLWGCCYLIFTILRKTPLLRRLFRHRDPELFLWNPNGDFAKLYESIKHHDAMAGTRLTKLKAEIHFASILMLITFSAAAYSLSEEWQSEPWRNAFLIFAVGAVGSFGAWYHFQVTTRKIVDEWREILSKEDAETERSDGEQQARTDDFVAAQP